MDDGNAASLADKTVMVTGAASGMGREHALLLGALGANVVLADLNVEACEAIAATFGDRGLAVRLDVRSQDDWRHAVHAAEAKFGPVDALINNAGIGYAIPFDDITEEKLREFIDINQVGVFLGMQAVVPSMRRAGGGSIVNISSAMGIRGGPDTLPYCGSKFAVTGMTKAAAIDLGRDGIRVNSVHPGVIGATGLTDAASDYVRPIVDRTPLGRVGTAEEVAQLILFLVRDGSFCTGTEFVIDGGLHAML